MKPTQAEAARLAASMTREAGRAVNPDEVMEKLASFDADAAEARFAGQFTVDIWDGTSPINGVSADEVRASRTDIPTDGTVTLIRDAATGAVVVFQPHLPEEGIKRMTPAVARTTGGKMVSERAQQEVRSLMLGHLRRGLGMDPAKAAARVRENEAVERRALELFEAERAAVREQVRREETERILKEARQR